MMADYNEAPFEKEICEHLAANNWHYSENSKGYDKVRALYPEDLFAWLEETQSDELAKVVKPGDANEPKQREALLNQLRKMLDKEHSHGGGTINLLRNGFAHLNAKFQLAQFRPDTLLNERTLKRFVAMRLRVVRQVYYSTQNKNSIDLVLFVNGLPVATIELKTDFTQSVQDAIVQYKQNRKPAGEPLLTPISGALVHFAVSNSDVYMTTRLAGDMTHFLPFNLGVGGGAGNPPNSSGSKTAYLWERILDSDTWLDILGKFVFVKEERSVDPITGEKKTSTSLRFPRLHQWDVVTKLVESTKREGAGHRYLVQHSAGSGKTDSISWTANRLSRLHDADDNSVFDSVIVITDRTVLDEQLQKAIRQLDNQEGWVVTVDEKAIRDAGHTSKSGLLADVLLKGTRIIVVTIQTFPFAMQAIRENKGLANKKFAVIADEAHSSQTGQTASKLKSVLSAEELESLEDGGEIDVEAVLAAEAAARADASNISYYAFTATPKHKTLELFGRPGPDDKPVPFHVYTMKQAIEEGYILDVLRGYQTYDTAFKIAGAAEKLGEEVDESAATKELMRWVKLHPTNIAQKVAIIVEHFRQNVAHLLDGHAKAMVVTQSRKAAVRYKLAIDKYIAEHDYSIGTIVAFSGSVDDTESGPEPFTEASMNPALRGRDIPTVFATTEFQVLLVANKFQTGFDQPLLSAMYVDKRLSGVTTVQTLSRLNRTYVTPSGEVKQTTMVLDFVNEAEDIKTAFEPYYEDAFLETRTDPNIVHEIRAKLDSAGIYTQAEVDQAADAWVKAKGNNALSAAVSPAQQRFRDAYQKALAADDKVDIDELDIFRKDVGTFVRVYDFMSQILDYGDPELEKRSIFLRLLERLIRPDTYTATVDLTGVTLAKIKQIDRGAHDLSLGADRTGLRGTTGAGSGAKHHPKLIAFQAIIDKLNELFGDAEFTDDQKAGFVDGLVKTLQDSDRLVRQAAANSKKQFLESPDLKDEVLDAVADNQGAHNKIADAFYAEGSSQSELVRLIGGLLHEIVREALAAPTSQ